MGWRAEARWASGGGSNRWKLSGVGNKPDLRSRIGSVPASGAVFRALAENFVRTE